MNVRDAKRGERHDHFWVVLYLDDKMARDF